MTTVIDLDKKCAICTETSPQSILTSTSTWGYPDLDLRPSEMQRSSMFAWLQECPYCGFVARDIEQTHVKVAPDFLKSDEYLTCGGHDFKSDLAKRFYRHYLISKTNNIQDVAFYSLLHCAWVCNDNNDDFAVDIRKLALKSLDKVDAKNDDERDNLKLIKADLLRRSLQFDELIKEFKEVFFEVELPPTFKKLGILDFLTYPLLSGMLILSSRYPRTAGHDNPNRDLSLLFFLGLILILHFLY